MLEQRFKESIDRYVNEGIPTGGFLQAVLENDLCLALGKADMDARNNLWEIVVYLYNNTPSGCWGNKDNVKNWFAKFNRKPE